jgi:hypothetical protein
MELHAGLSPFFKSDSICHALGRSLHYFGGMTQPLNGTAKSSTFQI